MTEGGCEGMIIAIASGKGGTGKTLIATSLATLWAAEGRQVVYVDADVEEPNGHLFLHPVIETELPFTVLVPALKEARCAGHGRCQEACRFNAILSARGQIVLFPELCHSCGACVIACPDDALEERERRIGKIAIGAAGGLTFVSGTLDLGEARSAPLIDGTLKRGVPLGRIAVVDAPPGTSCSAKSASGDADILLLVTEPTPFGLHDLALAVGMGRAMRRPLAAVINRADLGDDRVRQYLEGERIPILATIPFDPCVARRYARGELPLRHCDGFARAICSLADELLRMTGGEP